MGGGKTQQLLNNFSIEFFVTVHKTYQHMPCIVVIVDCPHVHIVHYKHTMSCCYTILMVIKHQALLSARSFFLKYL